MSDRLSQGQLAVLDQFNRIPVITKEIPDYWNPKPITNRQIDRLEARGFIEPTGRSAFMYRLTKKGASRIGAEICKSCDGATHPQEAACLHCGVTKDWAQARASDDIRDKCDRHTGVGTYSCEWPKEG